MKIGTHWCSHHYFSMGRAKDQAITILLVEDEGIIRIASASMLEDAGYTVIEAMNADDALGTLRRRSDVSVVVTDVQMPGAIDGLRLAEILAQDHPHIPTPITSGRAGVNVARRSGAWRFLAKSYTTAIQSAVASALMAS
jgi:two-component system, response regulator PdtaR